MAGLFRAFSGAFTERLTSNHCVSGVEVRVSSNAELYEFIVDVWPKVHGDTKTLMSWLNRASKAFPDVDLLHEARKAAVWEEQKASNKKTSIRRFLTNWWGRTQESAKPDAKVVSLSAVRWLSKNNKYPDHLFERWVRRHGVDEASVLSFSHYFGVSAPDSTAEVVEVFLKGV